MCRWMAWIGQPILIDELLFKTQHGIVDQSLHARMGAEPTNGDGFGMGWYGSGEGPALYRSVSPAWADPNLRELAGHIESPLFLAHVRAAIGSPVQQTNCHPFRSGNWLFVHNGYIAPFAGLRRELSMAMLLITHDLGVVSRWADRVAVMHDGIKVEEQATAALTEPLAELALAQLRTARH